MDTITCRREVPVDHPAFAGHFPGQPIVPGVLLLAEVLEALRARGLGDGALTIANAKFLAPVGPGAKLDIVVHPGAAGTRRFELHCDGVLAASGSLGGLA